MLSRGFFLFRQFVQLFCKQPCSFGSKIYWRTKLALLYLQWHGPFNQLTIKQQRNKKGKHFSYKKLALALSVCRHCRSIWYFGGGVWGEEHLDNDIAHKEWGSADWLVSLVRDCTACCGNMFESRHHVMCRVFTFTLNQLYHYFSLNLPRSLLMLKRSPSQRKTIPLDCENVVEFSSFHFIYFIVCSMPLQSHVLLKW